MLLYLDLNCYNRPFDDQSQERVARETSAVFWVLERVMEGVDALAWSSVLKLENSHHPLADRRAEIANWKSRAAKVISVDELVSRRARELVQQGLSPLDAAHLASAERGGCQVFLTCDDRLIRRARWQETSLRVLTPVEYEEEIAHGRTAD